MCGFQCIEIQVLEYAKCGLEELVSNPTFTIRVIENVEKWSHLGQNTNFNDNDDIELRKNCFIGQVNKILVHSSKIDPFKTIDCLKLSALVTTDVNCGI